LENDGNVKLFAGWGKFMSNKQLALDHAFSAESGGVDFRPHYSGGAENFPRLLEDWSGYRLTYYGSMVCLYPSNQANSKWITTGNYYSAPNRNWHFDKAFRNPNRLPPGTPSAVVFSQGQWVQMK